MVLSRSPSPAVPSSSRSPAQPADAALPAQPADAALPAPPADAALPAQPADAALPAPPVLPQTVDSIIAYLVPRRCGLLKALTTESDLLIDNFCSKPSAQPGDQKRLWLSGLANGNWVLQLDSEISENPKDVKLEDIPATFTKKWAAMVANACDAWLVSVAFALSSKLEKDGRDSLFVAFTKDRYTIGEVVKAFLADDFIRMSISSNSGEGPSNICSLCSQYETDVNWLSCDICEKWFHVKCVNVTSQKAEKSKFICCCPGGADDVEEEEEDSEKDEIEPEEEAEGIL